MTHVDDLSRSRLAFDQAATLVVVVEMSEASWLRLQVLARSGDSFAYRGVIVTFASPPTAVRHSDILPPHFQVSLDLTVKPSS